MRIFFFFNLLAFIGSAYSSEFSFTTKEGIRIDLEPVVGYERGFKKEPVPHAVLRFVYGARGIVSYGPIAGEIEALRSDENDAYPLLQWLERERVDRVKLGVRKPYVLFPFLEVYGRLGGQAKRRMLDIITIAEKKSVTEKWKISPYVGAGLRFLIVDRFSLAADGTIVMPDTHDYKHFEAQGTLSCAYSF